MNFRRGDLVRVVVDELSLSAEFFVGGKYTSNCKGVYLTVMGVDTSSGVTYLVCSGPGRHFLRQTILATDVEIAYSK